MPDEIDDVETPPDNPPGEPPLESAPDTAAPTVALPKEKPGASSPAPASQAPAPQPIFTSEQIRDLASGISQGITQGFKPAAEPAAASLPAGPSAAELQSKIDELDAQIDLAAEEGKPAETRRALMRQRDTLSFQKFELEHVAPLRTAGANSINSLVLDKMRADPYFVKYEKEIMALLGPAIQAGQALTVEIAHNALKYVKGNHIDEIIADNREAEIRAQKLAQTAPLPGATNGRRATAQAPQRPQTIKEYFGEGADLAMNYKRQKGVDDNQFARRLGFQDKAQWIATDQTMSQPDFNIGLDSVWDKANQRWVPPDQLNEFYGA
jgi:hypothetical protein